MLKRLWNRYWTWRNTEGKVIHTIVIARIKMVLGVAYLTVQQSGIDVTSFVQDPKWKIALQLFFAWLIVDGSIGEWGRRHKADDIDPPEPPPLPPTG